jgi:hypothetical protein
LADAKISALTAVTTPAGTDEFVVNQGGTTKKLSNTNLFGKVAVNVALGSATVNAGTFSMIQGAVTSDPTFSITQTTNDVAIAQTVGKLDITAVGEVVVNDASADVDFRIESDGNTNMLFVDAGNNRVGIANATPSVALDVTGEIKSSSKITGQSADLSLCNIKRFHDTVTLATDGAETDVGLTPDGVILSAAIRVSTEIAGLDEADHHIQLGLNGSADKYIDVAQGAAATTISVNKKGNYTFNTTSGKEDAALKLTITGGADQTPSAGAVEVEIMYLAATDLADV